MEKKEKKEGADAPPAEPKKPADAGGDVGGDDAGKDKNLISDMLKKHGALEAAMDEGSMQMASDMLQAYKEMGYEDGEAMKCAAHSFKLAKHMQGKGPAPAAPAESADDKKDPSQLEATSKVDDKGLEITEGSASVDDKGLEYKEASKQLITLKGEMAKLKEQNAKLLCEKHLDHVLKESGLPSKATKDFREAIKTPKSTEQIDADFKIFLAAYKTQGTSGRDGFLIQPEKHYESTGGSPVTSDSFLRD